MTTPVETFEGYYSLHAAYTINYEKWNDATQEERTAAWQDFSSFLDALEKEHDAKESSYACYHLVGGKGDILLWILDRTLEGVALKENRLDQSAMGKFLTKGYSFVSVIELSNHMQQNMDHPAVKARLYPAIPKAKYMCFYPMNKRRGDVNNWFTLTQEERSKLMRVHGMTGRKYEGLIQQFITGACGFDDWEWGVTLLAEDAVQFKKIVYEMRFDEVSAKYGEFGSFFVGTLPTDEVWSTLFPKK